MTIDKLLDFMIDTDDINFGSIKRCEYLINEFRRTENSEDEKQKLDYITEKLNAICEIKEQKVIIDLKKVYDKSSRRNSSRVNEIDCVLEQVSPKMAFNLEIEKTLFNNSEKIYNQMNDICSKAMTPEQFEDFRVEKLAYFELLEAQIKANRETISYDKIESSIRDETFQDVNSETCFVKSESIKMYDEWGLSEDESKGVDEGW